MSLACRLETSLGRSPDQPSADFSAPDIPKAPHFEQATRPGEEGENVFHLKEKSCFAFLSFGDFAWRSTLASLLPVLCRKHGQGRMQSESFCGGQARSAPHCGHSVSDLTALARGPEGALIEKRSGVYILVRNYASKSVSISSPPRQ